MRIGERSRYLYIFNVYIRVHIYIYLFIYIFYYFLLSPFHYRYIIYTWGKKGFTFFQLRSMDVSRFPNKFSSSLYFISLSLSLFISLYFIYFEKKNSPFFKRCPTACHGRLALLRVSTVSTIAFCFFFFFCFVFSLNIYP